MKSTKIIKARTYPVFIDKDVIPSLAQFIGQAAYAGRKLFILVDENSMQHCFLKLVTEVDRFRSAEIIETESGEENKNIEVCTQIWRTLSQSGADRESLFVNLGGGVIGDMGGFVASTFKRGIDFINIPTTLLAQVDASVGGKLGIDLDGLKNEIGVFNDPKAVFISPLFLQSLPTRHVLSGFAEIIKHALIADQAYWNLVKQANLYDVNQLEAMIVRSVEIKNEIVLSDPFEKNVRKALNFGHTIGHAIETYALEKSDQALLHGEAIAIGMICEAYLAYKSAGLSQEALEEISTFICSVYETASIEGFNEDTLLELMRHDKKNENKRINFTLLSGIGRAEINRHCADDLIKEALRFYKKKAVVNK